MSRFLSRRAVLRGMVHGTGIALGLPMLEAMLDNHGEAHADGTLFPRRFMTWMWGNGVRLEHWVPKDQGANYTLSDELQPLANVKADFTVLSGFSNSIASRRGHHDGMAGLFSGHPYVLLDPGSAPYASAFGCPSIDQQAADLIAGNTLYKSIQIGVSKRYESHQGPTLETMSHRGSTQPLAMERDPQALYDKIFIGYAPKPSKDSLRTLALDAVMADAKRLEQRVSSADKQRVAHHLESLFELQRQISALPNACVVPTKPSVLAYNPDRSEPLREINEAMSKIVAVAFACDLTRVISFMFTGASGGQQFPALTPDKFPEFPNALDLSHSDHHEVSHQNVTYEQTYIHKSVVIVMENLAFLLESLKATPEGVGNLLDNMCILAGSDCCEGWVHSENDYPIIVAGRAGGRLKSGVGHYRTSTSEVLSNVGLACLKAVAPDPSAVKEYGSDNGSMLGHTNVATSAIFAG